MWGSSLFLFASLIVPILAAPLPGQDISRRTLAIEVQPELELKTRGLVVPYGGKKRGDPIDGFGFPFEGSGSQDLEDGFSNDSSGKHEIGDVPVIPFGGPEKRDFGHQNHNVPDGGPGKRDFGHQNHNIPDGGPGKRDFGHQNHNVPDGGPGKRDFGHQNHNVPDGGPGKRDFGHQNHNVPDGGPGKRDFGHQNHNVPDGGPGKRALAT